MPDDGDRSGGVSGIDYAVEVRGLTRRFGDFTAVDEVTFDVGYGEIFGFLGPNGAGKTTTIKMLNGLLVPSAGEARVAGFDVRDDPEAVRRHIGYMSQRFSLYPDLTVAENIALFGGLYGVRRARLVERKEWVLAMAGLTGRGDRYARELPLGWKQRLALGCAVIHEPPILFLDEPTSGVDPVARRRFWDLIDELANSGTTVFVSTHYMEEAEYCHRLALMNRGHVIALDTPSGLRRAVIEPIVEVTTPDAPRTVEALSAAPGVLEAAMFGRRVHAVLDDIDRRVPELSAALARAGLPAGGIERVEPSLEDVFVSLVRREGGAAEG